MDRDHDPKMLMAFISRHEPTPRQIELAAEQGFELVHIGDHDAFTVGPEFVHGAGAFEAVAVVHPAAALRLAPDFFVGVFQNANRAPVGQPPQFEAVALHVFNLMD